MIKAYIGTKVINAEPMDRLAYNQFRGWDLPDDENGADEGYLVEYMDGGEPNTTTHVGYVSWSPKVQFDGMVKVCGWFAYRALPGKFLLWWVLLIVMPAWIVLLRSMPILICIQLRAPCNLVG
jgi:hypothetical protein